MKKIYCWVIFVYCCLKSRAKILLMSKDGIKYEPIYCEEKTCEQARDYLHSLLNLQEENFFPSRDINWWKSLSVSNKDETMFKIATSAARVRDNTTIKTPKGYKFYGWFTKEEAYELLKYWKGYTRSFKKIFTENTFWECISTEK